MHNTLTATQLADVFPLCLILHYSIIYVLYASTKCSSVLIPPPTSPPPTHCPTICQIQMQLRNTNAERERGRCQRRSSVCQFVIIVQRSVWQVLIVPQIDMLDKINRIYSRQTRGRGRGLVKLKYEPVKRKRENNC